MHIDNLEDLENLDLLIIVINFIFTILEPTLSLTMGTLVYYFFSKEELNFKTLLIIITVSMSLAIYIIPFIDMYIIKIGFDTNITPTIGFIIGIFSKPILSKIVTNTHNIVDLLIDKAFTKK